MAVKETMNISIVIFIILCLQLFDQFYADILADYELNRTNLVKADSYQLVGNKVLLTEKEQLVNNALMRWKKMNTDMSLNNPNYLNFSEPYFMYRDAMRQSRAYKVIRQMPKGAALHVHSTFMLEPFDLLQLTHEEHMYVCITWNDLRFVFSKTTPKLRCVLISDVRNDQYYNMYNSTPFDEVLLDHFSVGLENHGETNFEKNKVWKKLLRTISTTTSLLSYRPVREKMIYKALQNFYDDNIMYIEIRTGLDNLYELNGTVHDKFYSAVIYDQVARKFKLANPDFLGIKLIITAQRSASIEEVQKEMKLALKVKQMLPELFAGFDLVGQGKPLKEFVPILLEAKGGMLYFFHAGETNQYGTPMDENLFDAILLGTQRIGHGEALIKHPALVDAVARSNIPIEANVISNSMLSVHQDLRNNPLAVYLALGLPVVLSSSDPGVWGCKPLSDDFYVAFMAIASMRADLRMLKQLAINSIRYSALDDKGKTMLFNTFENKWDDFVNDLTEIH